MNQFKIFFPKNLQNKGKSANLQKQKEEQE